MKEKFFLFFVFLFLLVVPMIMAEDFSRGPTKVVLTESRNFSLSTLSPPIIILIALTILLFAFWNNAIWKKYKINKVWILAGLIIFWAVFASGYINKSGFEPSTTIDKAWQKNYAELTKTMPREYLEETTLYDYSNPEIQKVVEEIKAEAKNAEDAVYLTLQYTYNNIEYTFGESDDYCFTSKASDILLRGTGQCDTQTRLNIAILRGLGIMVRPVGGCIWSPQSCGVKFSIYAITGNPVPQPVWQEVTDAELQQKFVSRKAASRKGGLHAWLEVYIPDEGWIIGESTAGVLMKSSCVQYDVEAYVGNYETKEFCVTEDMKYAMWCQQQ